MKRKQLLHSIAEITIIWPENYHAWQKSTLFKTARIKDPASGVIKDVVTKKPGGMEAAQEVVSRALEVTTKNQHPSEGRLIYENALKERQKIVAQDGGRGMMVLVGDLEELYLAYVKQEVGFKQWKKVTQIFDGALDRDSSAVSKSAVLWAAYARFFWVDRNKPSKAKSTILKGLLQMAKSGDAVMNDKMWLAYLNLVSDLEPDVGYTLETLWEEVSSQGEEGLMKPSAQALEHNIAISEDKSSSSSSGRRREVDVVAMLSQNWNEVDFPSLDDNRSLNARETMTLFENDPPSLFTAPLVEPTKSGVSNLQNSERIRLDNALGEPKRKEVIKEMVTCLWTTQALKERHFDAWFENLIGAQKKKDASVLARMRLKMSNATVVESKRLKKEHEKNYQELLQDFKLQQELLRCYVNCVNLNLLQTQQRVLTRAGVPYFDDQTLALIEAPPLEKGALVYTHEIRRAIAQQAKVVGALLNERVIDYSEMDNVTQQQQQQPVSKKRRFESVNRNNPNPQEANIKNKLAELVSKFS